LNETRFGPKKSRPRYISAQNISTLFDALDEREIATLRFMLRKSSLVECVSVLHGTCLQCAEIFFYPSVCAAMFVKKSQVHFLYHKELAHARILLEFTVYT
jgi:hypothetical protein